jgi:hypothetical protein
MLRTPPSIAPHGPGQDTYLVLDDLGRFGRSWRKTAEDATDRETLIRDLVDGEFNSPIRIVVFNTAEGWSRDVTVDIADEMRQRIVGLRREISVSYPIYGSQPASKDWRRSSVLASAAKLKRGPSNASWLAAIKAP